MSVVYAAGGCDLRVHNAVLIGLGGVSTDSLHGLPNRTLQGLGLRIMIVAITSDHQAFVLIV